MTKRGIWPVRAMYMLVAVALVISLVITAAPPAAVAATGGDVKAEWDRVATPSMEDWVLAPESRIVDYAVADAGRVAYAIVETGMRPDVPVKDWAPWYLVKSTTHAATWRDITRGIQREIDDTDSLLRINQDYGLIRVATDGVDPDFLAVALWIDVVPAPNRELHVFFSRDGGTSFDRISAGDLDFDDPDEDSVFDLAVSPEVNGVRNLAIAGSSDDAAFICRSEVEGTIAKEWEDATEFGTAWLANQEAVVAVMFPLTWGVDATILAVSVTGSEAHLQSGHWGANPRWNEQAGLSEAVTLVENGVSVPWASLGGLTAGITLPTDYQGTDVNKREAWVWVNYIDDDDEPEGTILWVSNDEAIPVTTQITGSPWLSNVSYWGNIDRGKAIAGVLGTGDPFADPYGIMTEPCQGVQVYRYLDVVDMDICCPRWRRACKPPTGAVVMEAFYVTDKKAYAVALGGVGYYDETAWSFSLDDADTWNQLSLIDTHISYLSDVAVSPDCNKTMLVSVNFGPEHEGYPLWFRDRWPFDGPPAPPNEYFCDSVWYHAENLAHHGSEFNVYRGRWMRTWSGQLEASDVFRQGQLVDFFEPFFGIGDLTKHEFKRGLLRLAPEETDASTVYLVHMGSDKVEWNTMQTLACWDEGRASVDHIVDLALKNAQTPYALDFGGDIAMSDLYGWTHRWNDEVETELDSGWTLALWGDEILVGGQHGEVAHSPHGTGNFTEITEEPRARLPIRGLVTVAFDSYYGQNNVIYAATARFPQVDGGIYLWVVGEDEKWTDLNAEPSSFQLSGRGIKTDSHRVAYTGLVLDRADGNDKTSPRTGGVLYASYVADVVITLSEDPPSSLPWAGTGVARTLEPVLEVVCDECIEWDYLIKAKYDEFDDAAFIWAPHALKICGCLTPNTDTRLFAIGWDTSEWYYDMAKGEFSTVWTFTDCYSKRAPNLRNPAHGAVIGVYDCPGMCTNMPFSAIWDRLCDACGWEIQIALDPDFHNVLFSPTTPGRQSYWPDEPSDPSYLVYKVLQSGLTYYWRVRAVEASTRQWIRSWWSDTRSFTVELAPGTGVALISPEAGAHNIPRTNVAFTWKSVTGAQSYNFVLSKNADLSSPVEPQRTGLTTTGYTYAGTLEWDTAYYWRVQAIKGGAQVSSAMGTFRTMPEPPDPPPPPPDPVTPSWVWVLIAIGAVLVIVVIVLIFRTRRV